MTQHHGRNLHVERATTVVKNSKKVTVKEVRCYYSVLMTKVRCYYTRTGNSSR
jgi:hypothetical protein